MAENAHNSKLIAINTAMLYIRMLLIMVVTLYTSRVVLDVLGEIDYGIYNVVGGVIVFLAFLNSALNTATQRYMNYEMGRNNSEGLQNVFSMSFILYVLIAVIAVVLAETIGLWFVNNALVIPQDRMVAANWVYQFSILTFVVNLVCVPYNAAIIAHERMSIYAYISIAEVILKLAMVFMLTIASLDKLILYAILMAVVHGLILFAYVVYCRRKFEECKVKFIWNKPLLKGLFSFSGWMLSGTISNVFSTQGVNVLINMFFGPAMNAARGIAVQVNSAVNSFVANFMTAVRPQIVKSYAQGDLAYMYKLVFSSSKLSYYLLFFLSLPLILNADYVLSLWLKKVPNYAVIFTQLVLIDLLMTATYSAIAYVSQASGKVRNYQLVISVGFIMIAICTLIAFYLGFDVISTFIIAIIIDFIGLFARVIVLRKTVSFPIYNFLKEVCTPILVVTAISFALTSLPLLFCKIHAFGPFAGHVVWCFFIVGTIIWFYGINNSEKTFVKKGIKKLIRV